MYTVTVAVYQFDELNEDAQEKAIEWVKNNIHDLYAWHDEAQQSLEAFCDKFGVTLQNYRLGPWERIDYKTNANNSHFRGIRLSHIDREEMLTGYCLDNDLMYTFCDTFKATGDALGAFNAAIDAGFKAWRSDWEYVCSKEGIADFLRANEYEFAAGGDIWNRE
jgi:hypothetical protein